MFKLLSLITSHFYNLSQWADKLYDRFTVKNTWTTGVSNYPSGWSNTTGSYQISSFGNIIHFHLYFTRSSAFSTGNITNISMPTIVAAPDPYKETFDKFYKINSDLTEYPEQFATTDIQGGKFASIKATYCLSVIDGGLKAIIFSSPTAVLTDSATGNNFVGDSSSHIRSYQWIPSVTAVQTADTYTQVRSITVGQFYNLNPYPMLRQ